jgi:RNA polymerase sigma-70 factor (ECF subfamily)
MDADLVALDRINGGDDQGIVDLMNRHRESVFRFVFRFVRNEADAAELTEETFMRVFQNAGKYQAKAKVLTWICTIAGNLCRDFIRKNKKYRGDLSLQTPVGDSGQVTLGDSIASANLSPGDAAVSNELLLAIEESIYRLPHKLKFPFIFCVLEGRTYDECAAALSSNRKTVEMRIYRARKCLREELSERSRNR